MSMQTVESAKSYTAELLAAMPPRQAFEHLQAMPQEQASALMLKMPHQAFSAISAEAMAHQLRQQTTAG